MGGANLEIFKVSKDISSLTTFVSSSAQKESRNLERCRLWTIHREGYVEHGGIR